MCNIAPTLQAQVTSWKKRQIYKSQRTKPESYCKTVSSRENQRDWSGVIYYMKSLRINKIIILKMMMECHVSQGRLIADLPCSLFSSKTYSQFHLQLYSRPPAAHPLLSYVPYQWITQIFPTFSPSFAHPHWPLYLSLQLQQAFTVNLSAKPAKKPIDQESRWVNFRPPFCLLFSNFMTNSIAEYLLWSLLTLLP